MGSIITGILSCLSGPVINNLLEAYKARLASANTTDQKALELAIKDLEAQIEERKEARALSANPVLVWIQAGFGLWGLIWVGKTAIWDNVLGWGSTPALHGDTATYMTEIIAFFMAGQIVSGVVNTIAKRFGTGK